MDKSGEIATAN